MISGLDLDLTSMEINQTLLLSFVGSRIEDRAGDLPEKVPRSKAAKDWNDNRKLVVRAERAGSSREELQP